MWGASALAAVSSASLGRLSSDQGGSSVLIPLNAACPAVPYPLINR